MIPKIIHYCWFGRNPLPALTLKCIESWNTHLPDYEIIEWNEDNFDVNQFSFAKDAYDSKKYAFVSDVCRLYVLSKYGGIYLDTDMEILKPLDFINNYFVIGFEDQNYVAAGILISPIESDFIKLILNKYENLSFNNSLLNLKEITIPKIMTNELIKKGLVLNNKTQNIEETIHVYSSEYFYPLNYFTGKLEKTDKSYTIHHYDSSWMSKREKRINKLKIFLISIFGVKIVSKITQIIKRNAG